MTRTRTAVALACVAALVLLALGHWERNRAASRANAEMRGVFDVVGSSLTSRRISGYRLGPPDCLAYEVGPVPYALQLCFDEQGRLVETVDRRAGKPMYASLTWQPSLASLRFRPADVRALIDVARSSPKKSAK
jgi:hypothetical protein